MQIRLLQPLDFRESLIYFSLDDSELIGNSFKSFANCGVPGRPLP